MPDDIFYAYHVEHMIRHFGTGGCGARFFLDLYILNRFAQGLQSGSTATSLWRRIWLPYEKLYWSYPQLEGTRFLQLYYEAKRIIKMITDGRMSRSVAELKANRETDISREGNVAEMLGELGILKK